MDRVEGKDANNLLQSYTDILPGRPTPVEHRDPCDELRIPYDRTTAQLITKLHANTLMAGEYQTHDYYMNIGPTYPDPTGRQLYAEIASIEEQHVTQYESIIDASESWLEKWLLHEATEVYNYYSCVQSESNRRIKAVWERFLDYELGQLRYVADLFEMFEKRDAAEVLGDGKLPAPIDYVSHREFVRETLRNEVNLTAVGTDFVPFDNQPEGSLSQSYREQMNAEGSPSERVARGYSWAPGGELSQQKPRTAPQAPVANQPTN